MADDSAKKGMEVRTKLFGEKAAQAGDAFLRTFDEGFATFLNEQLFGTIWSRPGLPLKLRSLHHDDRPDGVGARTRVAASHARSAEPRHPARGNQGADRPYLAVQRSADRGRSDSRVQRGDCAAEVLAIDYPDAGLEQKSIRRAAAISGCAGSVDSFRRGRSTTGRRGS